MLQQNDLSKILTPNGIYIGKNSSLQQIAEMLKLPSDQERT